MQILGKLRDQQRVFEAIRELIKCLHSTIEPHSSAASLHNALTNARAVCQVTSKVQEMVTLRAFHAAVERKDWPMCDSLMRFERSSTSEPFGAHHLNRDEAAALQASMIAKVVCDLSIQADTAQLDEYVNDLKGFINMAAAHFLLSPPFADEVQRLQQILSTVEEDSLEDLDRKQKLHDAFLHNKVGPFFKSLTLCLAGIVVLAMCSTIFDQVLKDKSLELDFNMMRSVLDEIDEIDKQICAKEEGPTLPQLQQVSKLFTLRSTVEANASKRLLDREADVLKQLRETHERYMAAAEEMMENLMNDCFEAAHPPYCRAG